MVIKLESLVGILDKNLKKMKYKIVGFVKLIWSFFQWKDVSDKFSLFRERVNETGLVIYGYIYADKSFHE